MGGGGGGQDPWERGKVWRGGGAQSGWGVNLASAAATAASQPIEEQPCKRPHYHRRPPAASHVACFFFFFLSFTDGFPSFLAGGHWFHFVSAHDRKPTGPKTYVS